LVDGHVATAFGDLLPRDYVYQPHRSEALSADFYRSLQRSAGRTYLELSFESFDTNSPAFLLRVLVGPNAVGLALWHFGASNLQRFVARKYGENVRAVATTSILALLAYEHEHSALPERLEELVPGELQRLPIDDFDGAPLRYSRERRRLWSVGTDLRDEGGSDKGVTPDMKQPTFFIPG